MKKILLAVATTMLLAACSTSQVASSKFACGGISNLVVSFAKPTGGTGEPKLQNVEVCMGTNGSDRRFVHDTYGADGTLLKHIEYGSTTTEVTSALIVVGEVLKATSSNDATVASAAVKALPRVLATFTRLAAPIP